MNKDGPGSIFEHLTQGPDSPSTRLPREFLLVHFPCFAHLSTLICNVYSARAALSDDPLAQVVGLLALYTFHFSQPILSAPPLSAIDKISLPIGMYRSGFCDIIPLM